MVSRGMSKSPKRAGTSCNHSKEFDLIGLPRCLLTIVFLIQDKADSELEISPFDTISAFE